MKRKRYTVDQLLKLEEKWFARLVRATNKLSEIRKRLRRLLDVRLPEAPAVDETPPTKAREIEVDPLKVSCTTCDVGPGASCLRDGRKISPHKTRLKLAAEWATAQPW